MNIGTNYGQCCMPPYIGDEEQLTLQTYQQLYYRLERIALNVCLWKNLPENVTQMMLERYLYYFGQTVFFYDDILEQYVVLPMATQYAWDEYGIPTEYEVVGFMGYRRRLNITNSVIIWNNFQFMPSMEMAQLFATRLTNTLRTGDMHLEAQKIGKIVTVPEAKKKGVRSLLDKVKNFHLYTIASPAARELTENIQVLDTELEYVLDKMDNHYKFLWHDALSFFGVPSISDKISGVTPIEAQSENAMAKANSNAVLKCRKDAVEKINKMFDLEIDVSFDMEGRYTYGELYNDFENSHGGIEQSRNPLNLQ